VVRTADLLEALIAECRAMSSSSLPPAAVESAKHSILDWVGVTLRGAREPAPKILAAEASAMGSARAATLIGSCDRTSVLWATLVNGTAGHALDYDDTNLLMPGHPTAPILPALLAQAEASHISGRAVIDALVAGVEFESRLGQALAPEHYEAGWHATATLGTFGAAAASAHLMDLAAPQWTAALGIAASQSSGLQAMFGTMCKPYQVGKAAMEGLESARLASRGFSGPSDLRELLRGYEMTYNANARTAPVVAGPSAEHPRLAIEQTLFKYHAACYFTHSSIEAMVHLKSTNGLQPEVIDSIGVLVSPTALSICRYPRPETGLQCKFSLPAMVAMAALGRDTASADAYTDSLVADPQLVSLMGRVSVAADPQLASACARVVVSLKGGSTLEATRDAGAPAHSLETQKRRVQAKFESLASPLVGNAGALATVKMIDRLEEQSSIELLPILAG